jgi:carbamoyltransferase
MSLNIGLGGVNRHACAAVTDGRRVLGVCEQERITRVRGAGSNPSGVPDEALDAILTGLHARRTDISQCGVAEEAGSLAPWATVRLDHHEAHACAAFLTSPFNSAAVLICDHEQPGVSVWRGQDAEVTHVPWPWSGMSFSDLYTECSSLLGFSSDAGDQRFEALARMMAADPDDRLAALFSTDGSRISVLKHWKEQVRDHLAGAGTDIAARSRLAAALQAQIAGLIVTFLQRVQGEMGAQHLCLGGSLFFHSSINSAVRQSGLFARVFIPINPGNAGLSVGMAMRVSKMGPASLSSFMGPAYDPDEIKQTLDNCKLRYDWLDEGSVVATAVDHLLHGRLVGWYEGRMEWGPRALGARSILASPFSAYVLENLNHFLKRREPWRGYALSALAEAVSGHFVGPDEAPYMECDYRPKDVDRFRPVMPAEAAHIRVQTVADDVPRRFRSVLASFGRATGVPCLVNTSFNGFHEPIVCSPRDAVRVFFGSGLDVLIMDQFVLTK